MNIQHRNLAASETSQDTIVEISLSTAQRILPWLSVIVVGLGVFREVYVAAFGMDTMLQGIRHFALDAENTVAAWYSSHLMSASTLALLGSGLLARKSANKMAGNWFLLAAIFICLSLDEAASFHEEVSSHLQGLLDTGGIFYFAWVIPGSIFVAAVGLYFLPFLFKLPRSTALSFVLAGGLFVGGAIGMELIGGALAEGTEIRGWQYYLAATIEETLEIAGLTLFLWALLDYLKNQPALWAFR